MVNRERGIHSNGKGSSNYVKNSWKDQDFAAAGFWADDCGAIGSKKELVNLAKSVDVKYCVTGLGEVRWVLSRLLKRFVILSFALGD